MLSELDHEIADLRARRRQIRQTLHRWARTLASSRGNGQVFLLESLEPSGHG